LRLECLEDRAVPATFRVTTTADVVVPADGKRSLREAITAANNLPGADVIVLPAGVFKITIPGALESNNASGDFDVRDSLTIRGAGAGASIVAGQALDRVFDVFGTDPSSIRVVLQGLAIRNGSATGVTGDGGGIRVGDADLVIRDCLVCDNRAAENGGGISNDLLPGTGNLKLVRTTVARNVAGGAGGGISLTGISLLTIRESTVRRNVAAGSGGGGINAVNVELTNSIVSGNTAETEGGGITTGGAKLNGSTISGNVARLSGGGGILAGTVTLSRSTVSGNLAGGNGGGINSGTAVLTGSTVSGNTCFSSGGGIFAASANLQNVTIVENSASFGGGVFHDSPIEQFTVRNTIIAQNLVDVSSSAADISGLFNSQGHNLIGDGTGGSGFTSGMNGDFVGTSANPIDPKLGPLANNGGRTKTHALRAGSPAIDRGDNANLPPTDQRGAGFPRVKDGNGNGIATVDVGAFER
jgi:CSLREA domain-containing protein